ncbi:hypothetical protein LJ737_13525 [Hymenobacter sp. 15J16-1T3B]|uniref:hypothetical protein n=1 Tax=Hymenobacter sp. 15J16-1T3B TaxID=2886941 RepID=UPI001D11B81F|nr:hypothetical protein [Hymenobacter sp. 15J16-1T3B]MCC3158263.1 hypothetical protein [Hymenobacter sp. 15J16-1T3B]
MSREELALAGFFPADWIPSGTRYLHGELLVRMSARGSLRLFIPAGGGEVEVSSGSLFDPVVHYVGALEGVAALLGPLL